MTNLKTSKLCVSCGLCCYAFHNLGLIKNEKELEVVKSFGGAVFINQAGKLSFSQPCPAFNGTCSVYPNHPSSCKTYQCKLFRSLQNHTITFEKAKKIVANTKKQVCIIDSELEDLLGKRTIIVDDYIILFFKQAQEDKQLKTKHTSLLLHFGTFTYLRKKYFDEQDQ